MTSNPKKRSVHSELEKMASSLPLLGFSFSFGHAAPPKQRVTMTRSPRIVTCLKGNFSMHISRGGHSEYIDLPPMHAVFVERTSWNAPSTRMISEFLTLDFDDRHTRYYWAICPDHTVHPETRARGDSMFIGAPRKQETQSLVDALEIQASNPLQANIQILEHLTNALIHQAWIDLNEPQIETHNISQQHWETIVQYIDEHLDESLDRRTLADVIEVHPNHVSRIVQKHCSVSLPAYLNHRRVERATILLEDYSLSIKEIAFSCGFEEPNYFSSVFRRIKKMSPLEWRKARALKAK